MQVNSDLKSLELLGIPGKGSTVPTSDKNYVSMNVWEKTW